MSNTIKVDSATLADELAWLTKAKTRTATPALDAVQVSIVAGALRLRRTDGELSRESVLPVAADGQASVLVNPVKLRELLKGAAGDALKGATGDAIIDITDDRLRLGIDGRILSLSAAAAGDDYPAWPDFTATAPPAILRAPQLARALTSVSHDDTLPMLNAVRFEDGVMASTDRFRLSRITYDDEGFTVLIGAAVLRPFASGSELVRVEHGTLGEAQAVRVSNWGYGRTIIAPVVDAEFPKWRQLIPDPDTMPVSILLRRRDLLDAVDAGQDHVTLTVTEDGTQLLLHSTDQDSTVEIEQSIAVLRVVRGEALPFTVRLNAKILAGCLKGISAGAVQLMASAPSRPVLLQFSDDLHLIMPIRIPG